MSCESEVCIQRQSFFKKRVFCLNLIQDMTRTELLVMVIFGFVLLLCLKIYYESDAFHLKCILSSVDGNRYCVRETAYLEKAADLLAKITQKCKTLVSYLEKKLPDDPRVKRLVKNFNPSRISETLPTSEHTAFSENKGEKMAFCLTTKKKEDSDLIDENTLFFVALHELSHISCESIGHKQEFWKNFKFLLKHASDVDLYVPEDYKKKPKDYCGMQITDNPLVDL